MNTNQTARESVEKALQSRASATLLSLVFLAAFVLRSGGASILPTILPIGSEQQILEWAATNRLCSVSCGIYYTNTLSDFSGTAHIVRDVSFASYIDCRSYILSNGFSLFTNTSSRVEASASVQFFAALYYEDADIASNPYFGLIFGTNLGIVSQVTWDSFTNISPRVEGVVVSVTNMERLAIQVDSNPPYSYVWNSSAPATTEPPNVYPAEMTTNGLVILNQWYSFGTNRARFTIVVSGQTNIYTQHGDLLAGPTLRMGDPEGIDISMPAGSDTTIEDTTNFTAWRTVTNFPWYLATNAGSVVINPSSPSQFFRATSQ